MAGNDLRMFRREVAFADVEVGPAHTAGRHPHEDFAGSGLRRFEIGERERIRLDRRRRMHHHRFHSGYLNTVSVRVTRTL